MEPYVLSAISAGGLKIKRRVKAMNREKLLKNAKPILFNTEMVQAILEGRKTVTRRLINPRYREDEYGFFVVTCEATGKRWVEKYNEDEGDFEQTRYVNPPYQVGDILYVRETWSFISCDKCIDSVVHQDFSPGCGIPDKRKDYYKGECGCFIYRATEDAFSPLMRKWNPSIHMPKKLARIFLKVTDVRVERLQDITEEECYSEGFEVECPYEHRFWVGSPYEDGYESMCWADGDCNNPEKWCDKSIPELFGKKLWNSTIKKQDLDQYGWKANPWVWVIEFERE